MPMAGEGRRYQKAGIQIPKPLIDIDGEPMFIKSAKTIVWNGPLGFFEIPYYSTGTQSIAISIEGNDMTLKIHTKSSLRMYYMEITILKLNPQ